MSKALAEGPCVLQHIRGDSGLQAMKFAHEYEAALQHDSYPPHWVESAISYRQLKKCIKQVQRELSMIGLDPNILAALWTSIGSSQLAEGPLHYTFADTTNFEPKLILTMNIKNKSLVDTCLAPETRAYLQTLVVGVKPPELSTLEPSTEVQSTPARGTLNGSPVSAARSTIEELGACQKLEIPTRFDSTFFRLLKDELLGLRRLRSKEKHALARDIVVLGQEIGRLTVLSQSVIKTDIYAWREVFGVYIDCSVFFSTAEQDSYNLTSSMAHQKLQAFSTRLQELGFPQRLKKGQSRAALGRFIRINYALLQNLKFQELNVTAMTKILKSKQ